MNLHFVTRNPLKFAVAKEIMSEYGISLVRAPLETPEIQSLHGKKVCEFSARHAARQLNCPIVKSDVSYSISALNGFPGPYVKHINQWLTAKDLLKLMSGKKNRRATIIDYVSYAEPSGKVRTFIGRFSGRIASCANSRRGTPIDQLFIHEGYKTPQSHLSSAKTLQFFQKHSSAWDKLGRYLQTQKANHGR